MPEDDYEEGKLVSTRMHPPTRKALDSLIERHDDWSNRSDVIRGLIRDAAENEVALDGGPVEQPDEHVLADPVLEAVYRAAIGVADRKLKIEPMLLSSIAQAVNNEADVPVSPDRDAVKQMLRRLQSLGFAYKHTSANWTGTHVTSRWRVKPPAAVPDEWAWNEQNVEQRREQDAKNGRMFATPSQEGKIADD